MLVAIIGSTNAMAQEITLDFSTNDEWNLPTDYDKTEKSYTSNGVTITINAPGQGHKINTNGGYLIFGKKDATLTFSAFSFDVELIKITGRAGASGKVTQNIFVGDEAVSTETTGATGVNSYKIADGKQGAGTIYTLKLTNDNNTQITQIEIFKKGSGAKEGAGLSWGTGSRTVTIGSEENSFPELTNPYNLPVTYSSSKEEVATISADGVVTLVAAGSTVISASFAGNDTYEEQTVVYTLTVKAAQEPEAEIEEISVAQALEIIAALEDGKSTDKQYRVKGYLVTAPDFQRRVDETLYGNVNFDMADTMGGATVLTVFRAKDFDNKNFTEETINRIKEDDLVVMQGKLQKYLKDGVTTPELVSGYIYSVNGETSGIAAAKVAAAAAAVKTYTIDGRKAAADSKGLVIKNGKKLLQK